MFRKPTSEIKFFAYLRKSSEQEERQALSLLSQRDELEAFAKKEGLEIIYWFEEAHSAKEPHTRVKFTEMLTRIEKGEANGILSWHIDRLTRNAVDAGQLSHLIDKGYLHEIRTFGHTIRNDPMDKFYLALTCGQAKLENDNKGVNVRRGLTKKAKLGWRPNASPIGYLNLGEEKGYKTIQSDPQRFQLARQMWDYMLTGNYTVPQVWKLSKEWGLLTRKKKKIGGKPLSLSATYTFFTNSFYYGFFQYKDPETGEMVWQKGNHEPMISEEEFNLVQDMLGDKGSPRPKAHDMAFTGSLIRCAGCGSSITAEAKQKRQKNGNIHNYIYYHCTKKKDENCTEKSVELRVLDKQVIEILNNLSISERFKNWAIKNLHDVRTEQAEVMSQILKRKHKELENITYQLQGLLSKFTDLNNSSEVIITSEEYQGLKGKLLKRKNALEQELSTQGEEMEKWLELSEKTFNFAFYARTWYEKGDNKTKRAILGCLGYNLVLKDRKLNLDIHPFYLSILENKKALGEENFSDRTSENPEPEMVTNTSDPKFNAWLRG